MRLEDEQMITGEYFLSEEAKKNLQKEKKRDAKLKEKELKKQEKMKVFEAPEEIVKETKKEGKASLEDLKMKFLKKKKK